jgi:glycosyltransferase involved in cell wall biosynthesis
MNRNELADEPVLSVGVPVFNGARYIEETLKSLLDQSFADFEIIISDNASTDATEEICRAYVMQDARIRYYRSETNLGAAPNFNRVFALSRGKYFKWAAYDDLYERDFLLRCVGALEEDPTIVLVYANVVKIDNAGRFIKKVAEELNVGSLRPHERFRDLTCINHSCFAVFGVIRSEVLKKTSLIGSYVASDRVLLVELGLFGRFHRISDHLFLHREHSERSTRAIPDLRKRVAWFDTKMTQSLVLPSLRLFYEYGRALRRCNLGKLEKSRCYYQLIKWWRWNMEGALRDLAFLFTQLYGTRARG